MAKSSSTYCLSITIPQESYDLTYARIYELAMLGCEEQTIADKIKLNVYFKDEETAHLAGESLKNQFGIPTYSVFFVENQDWNAQWRASMKPARIARGWYVSPLWLPPPQSARQWIKIEPKMAFGTGHHETTRLASRAIIAEKRTVKNRRVLDIGCGSGVLCFVAAICGARICTGVELDECCRENLAENLRDNSSTGHVNFSIGSTGALRDTARFGLIVMNMIFVESTPLLATIARLLEPKGRFIWSGILKDEAKEVVSLAERAGFAIISKKTENEWWCGVFSRS